MEFGHVMLESKRSFVSYFKNFYMLCLVVDKSMWSLMPYKEKQCFESMKNCRE